MPHSKANFLFLLVSWLSLLGSSTFSFGFQDKATLKFEGEYRAYSKTSIVRRLNNNVKPAKTYSSVQALLDSLPDDKSIRDIYKSQGGMPDSHRVPLELKNVTVTCWIHAVKFEGGENGDNDFHVVIGTSADTGDHGFMNIEISGLPADDDIDFDQLKKARKDFIDLFPGENFTGQFKHINPARKVKLKGSLFFDGAHGAGCKTCPGPKWAKPQTVWELHPIYFIQSVQ
jgi:hypothetical protein